MTARFGRDNHGPMQSAPPPAATPPSAGDVTISPVPGLPIARPGDDPAALIGDALAAAGQRLQPGDVLVVASKLISRAEGRFVDLATVAPSAEALELAYRVEADARVVELVLRESVAVSRAVPGALIVRSRLGIVSANAGIDLSNARLGDPVPPDAAGPPAAYALLLPEDPDASADRLRAALLARCGVAPGVIISDSLGRPFRFGSVGAAIGVSGLVALWDQRGRVDLFGRPLEHTETALADQIAAAADLVAGQADEARGAVLVRGLTLPEGQGRATDLLRPPARDLYA
ncbi:MAG: coenzyme F420-0:L-glutamate ligase [Myxococcota bacterium]